jgi:hypothetical protein
VRWRLANVATGSGSADFEHVADLPLAAWRGLAASLGTFELARADLREDGAEVLVPTIVACETCRSLSKVVYGRSSPR